MAFAAQKPGSKSSVVICTKISLSIIISDLLFHQKGRFMRMLVVSGLRPGCIRTTPLSMCCFPVGPNYPEGVLKNLQQESESGERKKCMEGEREKCSRRECICVGGMLAFFFLLKRVRD